MESGVATKELDLFAYEDKLQAQVFRSSMIMRPVYEAASMSRRRIIFAEGEDERVLRTAQAMIEDTLDTPVLIGRPEVVEHRLERAGLKIRPGKDFELINPEQDERYRDYWSTYHSKLRREGVTPDSAKAILRTNSTAIAAVAVERGDADSMICGTFGEYRWHLRYVTQILENADLHPVGSLSLIILDQGPLFLAEHPYSYRAQRPAGRRIGDRGSTACASLWGRAQDRFVLGKSVWAPRQSVRSGDARSLGNP